MTNWSTIISEAATNKLGIAALVVLVLFTIALYFFRNESVKVKAWIFGLLFSAGIGFGAAATAMEWERTRQELPVPCPICEPFPPICRLGTWPGSDTCLPLPEATGLDVNTRHQLRLRCDGMRARGINHDGYTFNCADHGP